MILVTLGTQDKQFERLLFAVQNAIDHKVIQDRVIVQAGYTKFSSDDMEVFDYIEQDLFSKYLEEADIIITHGGVGTIMTALKKHKKILAAARLSEYKEHHNDHQTQLLEAFDAKNYLIYMKNLDDISEYFERIKLFEPESYSPNQTQMIHTIESWIEKNVSVH